MFERFYDIAGSIYRVTGNAQQMYPDDGSLVQYRTNKTESNHNLDLKLVERLSAPEGDSVFTAPGTQIYQTKEGPLRYDGAVSKSLDGAWLRIHRKMDSSLVEVKQTTPDQMIRPKIILKAMELDHWIVHHGGLLLHSSYIRYDDQAILFTAPSGAGKSTQADLWCRHRGAELINGDRSAVMDTPQGFTVQGIPYSGTSGVNKNVSLPLKAVVYLSQAPATTICPLSGLSAFRKIWEGCCVNTWDRDDMSICTQTVLNLVRQVPVYHLSCTPDESAVIALENELQR